MNLFEPTAAQDVLFRLAVITPKTPANRVKMNAGQMMAHCQAPFKIYFGEMELKQGLMGLLFEKMAKRKLLSPKSWAQNLPTAHEFKKADERKFNA